MIFGRRGLEEASLILDNFLDKKFLEHGVIYEEWYKHFQRAEECKDILKEFKFRAKTHFGLSYLPPAETQMTPFSVHKSEVKDASKFSKQIAGRYRL